MIEIKKAVCVGLARTIYINIYTVYTVFLQRGLSEAQNGYTFCMLLGYGPLTCRF